MHCPGGHLLPGPKFITELLPPCPPHPEPFANTCHPLSITKSPVVPRWHSCPQGATAAASLLPCRPLVQQCLLLCPEPCETTRLLPAPRGSGSPQTLPASEGPRLRDKKRPARSLPPCAPRCPEPGRLRFPPCGIRGSSASCRGQCRSHKVAKCGSPSCPELTGGYSLPLRGVTECPPQPFLLREYPGGVAPHRCSKGYPGQEFLTCYTSEQRLSSAKGSLECPQLRGVTKECPQLRGVTKGSLECPPLRGVTKECPQLRAVAKGTKECPPLRAVTKECPQVRAVTKGTLECPPLRGVTKECPQVRAVTKGCPQLRTVAKGTKEVPPLRAVAKGSALSRSRCPQQPRGPPRPSRLSSAGAKRSGHSKKSRCASKWLW